MGVTGFRVMNDRHVWVCLRTQEGVLKLEVPGSTCCHPRLGFSSLCDLEWVPWPP